MNRKTLTIAGWITMFSAFASMPAAYLAFRLEGRNDAAAVVIQTVTQFAALVLFLAITLSLKKLLNVHCRFHETDRSIDWMIKANVTAAILSLAALHISPYRDTLGMAALVIMVAQGVVQIRFGYRLLRLQDRLEGLLKPFCIANIITGACIVSLALLPVAVVVSALADLMLGTIFFNTARRAAGQPHEKSDDE